MALGIFNSINANGTTPLPVAQGGTGVSSLTSSGAMVVSSTGIVSSAGANVNNVLVGGTFGPQFASQNFPICSTIASSSSIAVSALGTGYILTGASLQTLTLSTVFNPGNFYAFVGKGAGLWKVVAGSGVSIVWSGGSTSSGGSLASTGQYDNLVIVGLVANTTWQLFSTNSAGLTIV